MPEDPLVLIAEDERHLADLYAEWLSDDYGVRTAHGGEAALDALDGAVDVALLDRRMPGLTGDEVVDEIETRDLGVRVALVSAVDPDFDIIEMGFDEYLTKPVDGEALRDTVERLLARREYDQRVQEHFSLASKKAVLESEKSPAELAASEEYSDLADRIDDLRADLDTVLETWSDEDFRAVFRGFESQRGSHG